MPLNFPQNPQINSTYTINNITWRYNGKGWAPIVTGLQGIQGIGGIQGIQGTSGTGGGASVEVSSTPPQNATNGDLWLNSETAELNVYLGGAWVLNGGTITNTTPSTQPTITAIQVTDNSYTTLDDTAVSVLGGYIKLTGTNFASGCQVVVGTQVATSVSFISSTEVRAQVPAQAAGTYTVYLTNSDGSVAIRVNGLNYSSTPTWTTTSPLPGGVKNTAISLQLSATSNSSVTYALASGSTLPSGLTLSSGGLLSGTVTGISADTTYNFTVIATDSENQDTPQAFQITIMIGDPYYELVTLHLPGNGTNLAQNNTFLDSSTNNFSITRSGNTTQGTFSPFSQTGWGNYFDGSSALTVGTTSVFAASSEDFTIECWVYRSSTSAQMICGYQAPNYDYFFLTGVGSISLNANNTYNIDSGTLSWQVNTWYHIAISRTSNVVKIFRNGSQVGSDISNSSSFGLAGDFRLGDWIGNSPRYYMSGYISNFRFVKGIGVYTGNFQTPITPLGVTQTSGTNILAISGSQTKILTCQGNRFLDASGNATSITIQAGSPSVVAFSPFNPTASWSAAAYGGSGYFDGTGDYLVTQTSTAFQLSTSNFSIEFWSYYIDAASSRTVCRTDSVGTGSNGMLLGYSDGTNIVFYATSNGSAWDIANGPTLTSAASVINRWTHFAYVRNGSTLSVFVNGSRVYTTTTSAAIQQSGNGFNIGTANASSGVTNFNGYLSGFRYIKGTTLPYDPTQTSIIVPTSPVTAVTDTQLLLNFTNAGVVDATAKNDLETVGNAQISTTQSRWGGSSMYFDGTGDYLVAPASPLIPFASAEKFTIEGWLNFSAATAGQIYGIYSSKISNSSSYGVAIVASGTPLKLSAEIANINTAPANVISSTTITTGNWIHFAAVYDGSQLKLYINGTSEGTPATTSQATSINTAVIGRYYNDLNNYYYNGYIQDLRITKGYARYTANFTPPTGAFPAL